MNSGNMDHAPLETRKEGVSGAFFPRREKK